MHAWITLPVRGILEDYYFLYLCILFIYFSIIVFFFNFLFNPHKLLTRNVNMNVEGESLIYWHKIILDELTCRKSNHLTTINDSYRVRFVHSIPKPTICSSLKSGIVFLNNQRIILRCLHIVHYRLFREILSQRSQNLTNINNGNQWLIFSSRIRFSTFLQLHFMTLIVLGLFLKLNEQWRISSGHRLNCCVFSTPRFCICVCMKGVCLIKHVCRFYVYIPRSL